MDKDISAACQMFLIPSTIMFAALANASTEGLKVLVASIGSVTALIWLTRLRCWEGVKLPTAKQRMHSPALYGRLARGFHCASLFRRHQRIHEGHPDKIANTSSEYILCGQSYSCSLLLSD